MKIIIGCKYWYKAIT